MANVKIPEKISEAIEKAGFSYYLNEEPDGYCVEVVGNTDAGGEMVHLFDFRCRRSEDSRAESLKLLGDISAWKEEARAVFDAYEVDEEVRIHDGMRGAPSLSNLIDDINDYKEITLRGLLKNIEKVPLSSFVLRSSESVEVGSSGESIDPRLTTVDDLINNRNISLIDFAEFFDGSHGFTELYNYDIEKRGTLVTNLQQDVLAHDFSCWELMKALNESDANFFDVSEDLKPLTTKEQLANILFGVGSEDIFKTLYEIETGVEPEICTMAENGKIACEDQIVEKSAIDHEVGR